MRRSAFTLIELSITLGLLAILFALSSMTLLTPLHRSNLASTTTTLVSDLRAQQLKAMQGDTEGQSTAQSYGIYLESGQYTLFRGTSYSEADPANFVVHLDPNLQLSGTPLTLVFARGSGEIASPQSFVLSETNAGVTHTFILNKYGVLTQN